MTARKLIGTEFVRIARREAASARQARGCQTTWLHQPRHVSRSNYAVQLASRWYRKGSSSTCASRDRLCQMCQSGKDLIHRHRFHLIPSGNSCPEHANTFTSESKHFKSKRTRPQSLRLKFVQGIVPEEMAGHVEQVHETASE